MADRDGSELDTSPPTVTIQVEGGALFANRRNASEERGDRACRLVSLPMPVGHAPVDRLRRAPSGLTNSCSSSDLEANLLGVECG